MRTILVLLDTFRKDALKVYNPNTDVVTPNLDKFAEEAYVFDNHCTGSLPCMPARRDLFTGKLDFFERMWGAIEPFDRVLQKELSLNGVESHIYTDHGHYWETGSEGYLQYFDKFHMIRGQENDHYASEPEYFKMPEKTHGQYNKQAEINATKIKTPDDYPTMQTFNEAIEFIEEFKHKDNYYIQVEGFDPHEPFRAPDEFMDIYGVTEDDLNEFYNDPAYGANNDTPEQLEHIQKLYKANTSFADYGFGKLVQKLKDLGIYDECNIIFTSDHGFHLGDNGLLGKGVSHPYHEISQIPLLHKMPNQKEQKRVAGITQNTCIMPTILDQYGIKTDIDFDGVSYAHVANDPNAPILDVAVTGYFASSVGVFDGEYSYYRNPVPGVKAYNYTAIPSNVFGYIGSPYQNMNMLKNYYKDFDENIDLNTYEEDIEMGRFLPRRTQYPVFKFDLTELGEMIRAVKEPDCLYKTKDFNQKEKLDDNEIVNMMTEKLKKKMDDLQVPPEQYERLGLK